MSLANSAVSGIADAWDTKQRAREKDLEEWAQDNPQWWVIGLATLGSTGMTVAGGFVDVLRIGEGAAEGGVMGIRSCGPAYDVYQRRRNGQPIGRRPAQAVERGAALAPRPSTLAGVQFRLNALGFGAGPEDGVPGPRTTRAERALRQSYPPLVADGVPGPTTQAKLVEVCACRATGVGGGAVTQKARHDRSRCRA